VRECGEEVKVNIDALGYPKNESFVARFSRAFHAGEQGLRDRCVRSDNARHEINKL
jgi:hypothetical protein